MAASLALEVTLHVGAWTQRNGAAIARAIEVLANHLLVSARSVPRQRTVRSVIMYVLALLNPKRSWNGSYIAPHSYRLLVTGNRVLASALLTTAEGDSIAIHLSQTLTGSATKLRCFQLLVAMSDSRDLSTRPAG